MDPPCNKRLLAMNSTTNPMIACDRCGSREYRDVDTGNYSLRRECSKCSRFMGWPRWRGLTVSEVPETKAERCQRILAGNLDHKLRPASDLNFDYERATAIARSNGV